MKTSLSITGVDSNGIQGRLEGESSWGGLYLFQHDFFVVPYEFGTLVKVYRFNGGVVYEDPLPPRPEHTSYIQ